MRSESARMSSAAEARFRVQAPNSRPRTVTVVALDPPGEAAVRRLADGDWKQTSFFTASTSTLQDLAGTPQRLDAAVGGADLVVLIAGPGGRADAAAIVGAACSDRRVMTTGFVVGGGAAPERELSKTLAQLRPWSLMLVVASADEYLDDMMTALRA